MAEAGAEKLTTKGGVDTVTIFRQFALLIGIAGSAAIAAWVVLWMQDPTYGVLFGKLEKSEAGLVIDALQQANIPYKLEETTGAILVPSKNVHDARIKLAAQGLPKSATGGGFSNLVSTDNTFGISESKENMLYQKALEQELIHTITSLNNVKGARVHLAIPKQSVFLRNRQKPRASVILNLYSGRTLNEGQVAAISHLVASSVPNLDVENVTVVDQNGRLLTNGQSTNEMAMTSTQFEYARKLEKSYMERIENILGPILGPQAVRAQVTADIDFTYNEQTQQSFNPESQVPVSEQISEERSTVKNPGGVPGALSNQPPAATEVPENAIRDGKSSTAVLPSRSSRKETRNFEMDKTISHTRFAMGRLRRLSAAVVVDDKVTIGENGVRSRMQRSPEEIDRITELVKKAIGFNIQRGDSVNIINEAFTAPEVPEELPEPSLFEKAWFIDAAKQLGGFILLLVILFGVMRPVIKNLAKSIEPIFKVSAEPAQAALSNMQDDQLSLTSANPTQQQLESPGNPFDRNMKVAQKAVSEDPKLVAQVVKNWVSSE